MEGHEDEEIYDDADVAKDPINTRQTNCNTTSPSLAASPEKSDTPISVKDRLKMFNNNKPSGFPVGPKPILPKKPVVTAKPVQSSEKDEPIKPDQNFPAKTQNSEPTVIKPPKHIPPGARSIIPMMPKPTSPALKPTPPIAAKPPTAATKPAFKKPENNAGSNNLLTELKTHQKTRKFSLCQSDTGETFRKLKFEAAPLSDRPKKPDSLSLDYVDLPDYTFNILCNGCKNDDPVPVRTNPARQNDELNQFERLSEKIKSLTEEEELAMDGEGSGGSSNRIPGGHTDEILYEGQAEHPMEEEYDTCGEPDGLNLTSSNHLPNGVGGGSTANLSPKEAAKIEREKTKKDLKNQKKLQEKEKTIQKEQEKIRTKYHLTDEEIFSTDYVRCAKQVDEGKNLPFSLNPKQAVFLVKKVEKKKLWIIKNQDGKLGVVDENVMELPEPQADVQKHDDDEQEDVYEEVEQ